VDSKQHLIVGADIEPGQPGPDFVNSHMQSRRPHGIRGWLAIVTLVAMSFASYGGMLYLFDTYVKGEAGAFASMTLH
jgi:hypothetical protein